MDPLSIAASAVTLTQAELDALFRDLEGLQLVNESIETLSRTSQSEKLSDLSTDDTAAVERSWNAISLEVGKCEGIVKQVEKVMDEICGEKGPTITGRPDKIGKAFRKMSKEQQLSNLRGQLRGYQQNVSVGLDALNICYTIRSRQGTKAQIDDWRVELDQRLAQLGHQIASSGEEVRNLMNSASNLVSRFHFNEHFYPPRTSVTYFTGREDLLNDLRNAFTTTTPGPAPWQQKRFVIYGMGGSGKTEFCCRLADMVRHKFWGVFTVDLSSPENTAYSYGQIAKIANLEANGRAVKSWLSNIQQPWLLTIDNADDPDLDLENYMPGGERGCVLITTRNPKNRLHGTVGQKFLHLEKMRESEAIELLLTVTEGRPPWDMDKHKAASAIANALGFLPLALVHAGKAIFKDESTWDTYLDDFYSFRKKISDQEASGETKELQEGKKNVFASFDVIYAALEKRTSTSCRDAIQLLNMFAFLHHTNIRLEILLAAVANRKLERHREATAQTGARPLLVHSVRNWSPAKWSDQPQKQLVALWDRLQSNPIVTRLFLGRSVLPAVLRDEPPAAPFDEGRLRRALAELSQRSLISEPGVEKVYTVHPVVHSWLKMGPNLVGHQAVWCEAAASVLTSCVMIRRDQNEALVDDMEEKPSPRTLLPHVVHVQRMQEKLNSFFEEKRQRNQPWWHPVSSSSTSFGPSQAWQQAKFSAVYFRCGRYQDAKRLQETVWEYLCLQRGQEDLYTIGLASALALTNFHLGYITVAGKLQSDAVSACKNLLGEADARTLTMMDLLGTLRLSEGRLSEAKELHEQALRGLTLSKGAHHKFTLEAQIRLGEVLQRYFEWPTAHTILQDAFDVLHQINPTSQLTLRAKENLALACSELKDPDQLTCAHRMMLEVLADRENTLGKEHPYTLLAILNLSNVLLKMGRLTEAAARLIPGLEIAKADLGEDSVGVLHARAMLAQVFMAQQRLREATQDLRDVLARHEKRRAVAGEHPERTWALWLYSQCLERQGRIADALKALEDVYDSAANMGVKGRGLTHQIVKDIQLKREELQKRLPRTGGDEASEEKPNKTT